MKYLFKNWDAFDTLVALVIICMTIIIVTVAIFAPNKL